MRGLIPVILALLVACRAPSHREVTTYHFQEGGAMTCNVDGAVTLSVEVRDGNLIVNGANTGPYRAGAPVRFLSAREIVVDGEQREIP
jgi:hypothetical protein